MADEQLKFDTSKAFSFRTTPQDNRNVSISAFSGSIQLNVWDKNQPGGPIERITISSSLRRLWMKQREGLLAAQPNTVLTLEQKTWCKNPDGKGGSFTTRAIFKFIKDEKQVYAFEISTPKMINPVKCIFKSSERYVVGTEEYNESELSALSVQDFLDFLKIDYNFVKQNSRFNMPKVQPRGNFRPSMPNHSEPSYVNQSEDVY